MKRRLLIIFLAATSFAQAQTPQWFSETCKRNGLDKQLSIVSFLRPPFLEGDFNGDSLPDIAVAVMEKATKKKGILLIHGGSNRYFLFGAGKKFGNGSDNFSWANRWMIYTKKTVQQTKFDKESGDIIGSKLVKLTRPGILVSDEEDGTAVSGGIIYWNGKKYIWIQQGE